ncbi:hypothetical protein, partial [Caulobacter sp. 17J65-9]|uniref:hypothetical protein n=1 Tax=Caulobacter sp. 17J65-9 TaxID=2709382 RepID=UPI0013CC2663
MHAAKAAPSIARGWRPGLTAEAHAELVDAVYVAATDPEGWTDVFAKVRRYMGGHGTMYERCVADPRSHRLALASLDPEFIALYNSYYNATNLWATSPKAGDRSLYVTEEVVDGPALERTEFFADWLRPQGLRHGLSCRVGGAGGRYLHLGLVRETKYGGYDADEVRFLESLTPHLRRAIEISHRLGAAEAQADAALDVLGRRGVATVLVDSRGVVHAANAAADELMRDGGGLTVRAGR